MEAENKNFELQNINEEQIPSHVQDALLKRTRLYVSHHTPPLNIHDMNLYKVEHDNGDTSYLGEHVKTYLNGQVESNTHIIDTNKDSEVTGVAEIRFANDTDDQFFKNKPFVGWTKTIEGFESEGLGRRRVLLMNVASLALYGHLLHSDTLQHHPAVSKIWDRLVDEGLATKYIEPNKKTGEPSKRYRFVE